MNVQLALPTPTLLHGIQQNDQYECPMQHDWEALKYSSSQVIILISLSLANSM